MKKIVAVLSVAVVGLVFFLFAPKNVKQPVEGFLGANFPDRCVFFDQFASRSTKEVVKAASGKLYSYRVGSTGGLIRYFNLHNSASEPATSATRIYTVPLSNTTSSNSPSFVSETFASPMDFSSGIGWSISDAFATWASPAQTARNNYFVTLCYY